jgi:hypothetical protein
MCSDKIFGASNLDYLSLTQARLRLFIELCRKPQFFFRLSEETDGRHFRRCSISERASSMSRALDDLGRQVSTRPTDCGNRPRREDARARGDYRSA